MKTRKYHGRSLTEFVPITAVAQLPRLTAEQFATLDLWSAPRGVRIIITDVPVAGNLILIRTSSALRFNWAAAALPVPPTQLDLRRVAEAALYGATTVRRQAGVKIAGYRTTRVVVIWQPLCRTGREAMERLNAEMVALWKAAQQLCVEAGTVLAQATAEEAAAQ